MKILLVNMTVDPINGGGTAERTVQLSKFLLRAGHEPSLITTDDGSNPMRREELLGVKTLAIRILFQRFYISRFPVFKIRKMICQSKQTLFLLKRSL